MKSNKNQPNNNPKSFEQVMKNKTGNKESVPAQKDGFRYDYNDNAEL